MKNIIIEIEVEADEHLEDIETEIDAISVSSPETGVGDDWAHPDVIWVRRAADGEWFRLGESHVMHCTADMPEMDMVVELIAIDSELSIYEAISPNDSGEEYLMAWRLRAFRLIADWLIEGGFISRSLDLDSDWTPGQFGDGDEDAHQYLCEAISQCIGPKSAEMQKHFYKITESEVLIPESENYHQIRVTILHAASSYGMPVAVGPDGEAVGPGDIAPPSWEKDQNRDLDWLQEPARQTIGTLAQKAGLFEHTLVQKFVFCR